MNAQRAIIEQMIDPTLFGDDLSNVPITWENTEAYTFDEVTQNDPDAIYTI